MNEELERIWSWYFSSLLLQHLREETKKILGKIIFVASGRLAGFGPVASQAGRSSDYSVTGLSCRRCFEKYSCLVESEIMS